MNTNQYTKIEQVIKDNPNIKDSKEGIELLGDVYSRQRRWEEASVWYKKLVTRYPNTANYHYKYGGVLGMMALANKIEAMRLVGSIKEAFKKAASLDPDHQGARGALVKLYIRLPGLMGGSTKKALHYAEELEQLSIVEGAIAKGYIYEHDQQPEKAKQYYIMALAHLKEFENASINEVHYTIGELSDTYATQFDDGLYHLKKYIDQYTPIDRKPLYKAYYYMARIYRQKKEKEKAMLWISKTLDTKPDFKEALKEKEYINAL